VGVLGFYVMDHDLFACQLATVIALCMNFNVTYLLTSRVRFNTESIHELQSDVLFAMCASAQYLLRIDVFNDRN
jgi:hypothetical protein